MREGLLSFSFTNTRRSMNKRFSSRSNMTGKTTSSRSLWSHHSSQFATVHTASTATPAATSTIVDTPSLRGGHGSQRSLGGLLGGAGALDSSLHYGKLEELLTVRIPAYFTKIKCGPFRGLADKSPRRQLDLMLAAIGFLEDCLAARESQHFSFDVLVDIHSSLGILYEEQGDAQAAIDYYTSALWLLHKPFKSTRGLATTNSHKSQSPSSYDLNTQVAINLYRLGGAYGKLGQKERMHEAYDRAECFREGDIFLAASLKP